MAIEIKELIVKVQVQSTPHLPNTKASKSISSTEIKKLKKEIVSECLNKMKEWIERQNNR